jgi:hypothetical protein
LCHVDNPHTSRALQGPPQPPLITVFNDLKFKMKDGHVYMFGFYEQAHLLQPRVPRYWWYSKSGGDWKVGLGHDDSGESPWRIRKGHDEALGYTYETVLPVELDKRLLDIANNVNDGDTYEIDEYWVHLTLPNYYKEYPEARNQEILNSLLNEFLGSSSSIEVPRGNGEYYKNLAEYFSSLSRGVMKTYSNASWGHEYVSSAEAEVLLENTSHQGSIGAADLIQPKPSEYDAHEEQTQYKRSELVRELLDKIHLGTSRRPVDSHFALVDKPCQFHALDFNLLGHKLRLEYGIIDYDEDYSRPGHPAVRTKPLWVRNLYIIGSKYLNSFGTPRRHIKQLSFLMQKPFDYDEQAGIDSKSREELWDYTKGRIDKTPINESYVSLTGHNERFSPLVRTLKTHHNLNISYRPVMDAPNDINDIFLAFKGAIVGALNEYKDRPKGLFRSKGRSGHKRVTATLECLLVQGLDMDRLTIILSSVFVRNALPGRQDGTFKGSIRTRRDSLFGYFVKGVFKVANTYSSVSWSWPWRRPTTLS